MKLVLIAARGHNGLRGKGKLRPRKFLPVLRRELALHGVTMATSETLSETQEWIKRGAQVLINVFNEQHERDDIVFFDDDLPPHFAINPLSLRDVLNDKRTLSEHYKKHGIPTPADSEMGQDGFEIYATNSSRPPRLVATGQSPQDGHHVTKFIETSRPYKGRVYRTYVRLFAIGPYLISGNVGVRPWAEDKLSVHLMDTPLDAELINHFQWLLVDRNIDRFRELAKRLGDCLGPGLFAHDVVVESETQNIYVCETGIKFEIGEAENYFAPVRLDVPALDFHLDEFAKHTADGIVRCANDNGVWNS